MNRDAKTPDLMKIRVRQHKIKMLKNKKAAGVAINNLVIIILAVIALVVILLIFSSSMRQFISEIGKQIANAVGLWESSGVS